MAKYGWGPRPGDAIIMAAVRGTSEPICLLQNFSSARARADQLVTKMTLRDDLKSKLTTRNLTIIGIVLIIIGNSFSWTVWNVKLHELLANVGALILVVGVLQWFFDEESRQHLVDQLTSQIGVYLNRRDNFASLGATECTLDSKSIISEKWAAELIGARPLAIGIHYSDGIVARFEPIIRTRIANNRTTQILHSDPNGLARSYLERCLSVPVDLPAKVSQLQQLVSSRFSQSSKIRLIQHGRVLRYSFVFSEQALWLIFLTNSDGYEPALPAFRISAGTPLFEFFKRDIQDLGIAT